MTTIGYAGALLGGLLTVLSPCAALLVPSFFAYAFTARAQLLGRTAVFFAGLLVTMVPLGLAAGAFGMVGGPRRVVVVTVLSYAVIAFGVLQAFQVRRPRLPRWAAIRSRRYSRSVPVGERRRDPRGVLAVFVLGATYGVAGVCSGPVLGSVLAVAAVGGDPAYGAAVLAVYSVGMVVPVFCLALVWPRWTSARRWRWLRPRTVRVLGQTTTVVSLVSGALFVAIGVLLLATGGTADLGGLLGVDAQFRLESALLGWTARVPDVLVVAGGVLLVLAVVAGHRWSRRGSGGSDEPADPHVEGDEQHEDREGAAQDALRQPVSDPFAGE